MKHLTIVLATTLLAASAPQTDPGLSVRYADATGRMSLTMSHDISVRTAQSIATRDFAFDLTLAADRAAEALTVTIDGAKASYVAHDMKQRLGTRHLPGRSFPLSIADDGRQLKQTEPSDAAVINLGAPIKIGLSIAGLLTDTLPVLPDEAVAVGATWTTERQVRSLEGWAWGTGRLTSHHRVTAVDRRDEHTIVSVTSEARASLSPVEGGRGYTGELKRTSSWAFDTTDGRLLSISIEQESEGTCPLPQFGETWIRQLTHVELLPAS